MNRRGGRGVEWADYWRSTRWPVEGMRAHFERHTYHRHSHETYSFGLTESGAQTFTCRGAARTSAAGMVMAFNPDEPHDGRAATESGFTYRMLHIGTELLAADRPLPLFTEPVRFDPVLASALRRLDTALRDPASRLDLDERLDTVLATVVRRGARNLRPPPTPPQRRTHAEATAAGRARAVLHDAFAEDISAVDLAELAGCSRYALYRAFKANYGLAPSEYQRQLRLRAARGLIAGGQPVASVAVTVGFADQAHLSRWFSRCYGITPGAYRLAAVESPTAPPSTPASTGGGPYGCAQHLRQ